MRVPAKVQTLIRRKNGIALDISFGGTPQPRSVTLGPSGDLRHDPTTIPFPLPANCVHQSVTTHVLEFLPQGEFFRWCDELWRVTKPYGVAYLSGPYGGDESLGWLSDPTHKTRILEVSFAWLDPRTPMYPLHASLGRPTPKPWWPLGLSRVPGTEGTISYNVVMQKRPVTK